VAAVTVAIVLAAGGVVWRRAADAGVEVLLVHRPKYDDWSLPKGKLHPGEDAAEGALREVAEETGLRCTLGDELPSSSYVDRQGRPKLVRYWAMQPVGGRFEANDEVDEVRWLPLEDAARVLSYLDDRELLSELAGLGH
jgi:8-oxo-dGTP pyrophosphatase MutT (NUDIX family)